MVRSDFSGPERSALIRFGAMEIVAPNRQARALRNDERILQAARAVLAEQGPDASTAAIARRAGVGVAALFRRYPTKEELLRQVSIDGMARMTAAARDGLAAPDAWEGFAAFMRRCVDEGGGGLLHLAGSFRPDDEQLADSRRLHDALAALVKRAKRDGGLRADVTPTDVYLLLSDLRVEHPTDPARTPMLRRRHLALLLDGLRAAPPARLPAPAVSWSELRRRWTDPPRARR